MGIEKIKKEELLDCIKIGMTNQEIADKYNLTLQGVKQRISVLLKRENVRNRIELINKYKRKEVMLKLDKKYENQIFEVGEIISNFKTIEDLIDHAVLMTMNWDSGDGTVDFNYKDICGTIYEQNGYLQLGDEFESYNGCNFSKVNVEYRLNKLQERLKETDSESAYILEDIMKEL